VALSFNFSGASFCGTCFMQTRIFISNSFLSAGTCVPET
jgi:hypothetical protein